MKGVKHTKTRGIRVYVKVGSGKDAEQREKRFPPGTRMSTIKEWRRQTDFELRERAKRHKREPGSLAAAIDRYLPQVKAMPTYAQREEHLRLWQDALGKDTPLVDIGPEQIRTVLSAWRAKHSAATCNKRRTALMHLFSLLHGKGGRNPVREVPKFPVSDPLPRGRDPHEIDAALTARAPSRMRATCRVLLWTGMRPAELNRAAPEDFDEAGALAIVRTAKGGRTRVVPLSPQGVAAWKEFRDLECWQKVPSAAPLNRWLKHVTGKAIRVYDLRHSYGTQLARVKTRLDVIAKLLGHSTLDLTRRYLLAAAGQDAIEATAALGQILPPSASQPPADASRKGPDAAESGRIRQAKS